jgi:hypothetical protein
LIITLSNFSSKDYQSSLFLRVVVLQIVFDVCRTQAHSLEINSKTHGILARFVCACIGMSHSGASKLVVVAC